MEATAVTSGATYSPGSWFALVSPSMAVLVDPEVPSESLEALWQLAHTGAPAAEAVSMIVNADRDARPPFALAVLERGRVHVFVRGRIGASVQSPSGSVRQFESAADGSMFESWVEPDDVVWFVRPGARPDGVALPVVVAAVLCDVLSWQPGVPLMVTPAIGSALVRQGLLVPGDGPEAPAPAAAVAPRRADIPVSTAGPVGAASSLSVDSPAGIDSPASIDSPAEPEQPAASTSKPLVVEPITVQRVSGAKPVGDDEKTTEPIPEPTAEQLAGPVPEPVAEPVTESIPEQVAEKTGEQQDDERQDDEQQDGEQQGEDAGTPAEPVSAAPPVTAEQTVIRPEGEPLPGTSAVPVAQNALPSFEAPAGKGAGIVTQREPRRLSAAELRSTAARPNRGLGSHPRRRYGAWDWSGPERGRPDEAEEAGSGTSRRGRRVRAEESPSVDLDEFSMFEPAPTPAPPRSGRRAMSPRGLQGERETDRETARETAHETTHETAHERRPQRAQAPAEPAIGSIFETSTSRAEPQEPTDLFSDARVARPDQAGEAPSGVAFSMFGESAAPTSEPVAAQQVEEAGSAGQQPGDAPPAEVREPLELVPTGEPEEPTDQAGAEDGDSVADGDEPQDEPAEHPVEDAFWLRDANPERRVEVRAEIRAEVRADEEVTEMAEESTELVDLPPQAETSGASSETEQPEVAPEEVDEAVELLVGDADDAEAAAEPAGDGESETEVAPVGDEAAFEEAADAQTPTVGEFGYLEFSDGQTVAINGPVIIGRAPSLSSDSDDASATLVPIVSAGRGISRNHVRIDTSRNGLFVVDLGSRNGSTLRAPDGSVEQLAAWVPYSLTDGSTLTFADSYCYFRAE